MKAKKRQQCTGGPQRYRFGEIIIRDNEGVVTNRIPVTYKRWKLQQRINRQLRQGKGVRK
jgi:hypothetical protein